MDENQKSKIPLTQDEKGLLHGGFQLQSASFENHFFAENGNCKGGGWFDHNINCNRCSGCDFFKDMESGPQKP